MSFASCVHLSGKWGRNYRALKVRVSACSVRSDPDIHCKHSENQSSLSKICRQKREDICVDCLRSPADTDEAFQQFKSCKHCLHKAIMVCKDCSSSDLRGVSLHSKIGQFEAWCLDSGVFINRVRPPASLIGSQIGLQEAYIPYSGCNEEKLINKSTGNYIS